MVRSRLRLAAFLAIVLLLPSCLNYSWVRNERGLPIPDDALAELVPGTSLSVCLEELGAPLYLWRFTQDGMALAWGSASNLSLGFTISVSVTKDLSGSLNYDHINERFEGVVLVFDEQLKLRWIRRGFLSEIGKDAGRVPSGTDE